ncbi:TorD/DmsD family molecular chaperone [Paracoccus jiaweipingae]|uniref:TorD/DmsD family molecular chaperone n=1 Tax=unclassified Paracoccus (in: a-proteobacteria) TaxID=2688777 RepID=UPI0037994D56
MSDCPAMSDTASNAAPPPAPEDSLRADMYGFLAALLRQPPDAALLARCAGLRGDDSGIGQAVTALAAQAAATDPARLRAEYDALFIGLGRGELLPYGSVYLTGFLNEKPLALLRQDMARLGLARQDGVPEPEDHIASLMESMAALITGRVGAGADLAGQAGFFARHIAPWAPHFMADLAAASAARFYAPVGKLGAAFMAVEAQGFRLG